MSKTFRQWVLFLAICAVAGFMVDTLFALPGTAGDEARNEVRMTVDFTVLPIVLPDGTEAPAEPAPVPEDNADQAAPAAEAPKAPEAPADMAEEAVAAGEAPVAEPAPVATKPAPAPTAKAVDEPAGTGQIRSITLDETGLGFSLMIVTDRAVGDTDVMHLTNPRRLVIDLKGKWNHKGANVLRSEGAVEYVVLGEHPDRFRMVVHFRTPPKGKLDPEIKKAGNELHVLVPMP